MLELLRSFTGGKYPRGFANPYRCDRNRQYFIINSMKDLTRFIAQNDFKNCYVTVYSFTQYNQDVRDKNTAVIDTIPFDFDDEEQPHNALLDTRKFINWTTKFDIDARYQYSGNKGYHAFIDIEPIELQYPQQTLKRFVRDMQEQAKFLTLDPVVPGDLDRVIRIPNTINDKTGRYCIPLKPVELKFFDNEDIEALAEKESEFVPERKPLPSDSLVHDYLRYYDAIIAEEVQEAEEEKQRLNSTAANSKFGNLLITDTTCPAYDDVLKRGAAKGERDYSICGIILRCRKHHMSEAEIRGVIDKFNKKCIPPMSPSYIDNKIRYHMNSNYSPCTFLRNVSEECLKCNKK